MGLQKKIRLRRKRRVLRVRGRQFSRGEKLRIAVFRSLNHIYAQIIDDNEHKTVLSLSSINLKKDEGVKGSKKDVAKQVGLKLGEMAIDKKFSNVFFDRGGCFYHGRVSALAEGLRESGLKF